MACADDGGGNDTDDTDTTETGGPDEPSGRKLIIEPGFGPLCLGATMQQPIEDLLSTKLHLELPAQEVELPDPRPYPSAREEWDPIDLALSTTGREGPIGPGGPGSWANFDDQGARVYYAQEPFTGLDLLLVELPINTPAPGEEQLALTIRVAAESGQDFVLHAADALAPGSRTMTYTASDEQGMGLDAAPVEACALLAPVTDTLTIDFERGQLEAEVALFAAEFGSSAIFRDAQGSLDGTAFEQLDTFELGYTYHDLLGNLVSLVVRFPTPIEGACGLRFEWFERGLGLDETNPDSPAPTGHTIDCELEPLDELALSSVSWQ